MRILALMTDAFGGRGGIACYNRDLATAWAGDAGVERVRILCRGGSEVRHCLPASVYQDSPHAGSIAYGRAALAAAAQEPWDCIFCGHLHHLALAAAAARRARAWLWCQLHGIEAWRRGGWLTRAAIRRVRLYTAVSRCTRERFLAWAGCAPERVRVLPNTVSERFAPGPAAGGLARRRGLVGRRVLLSVSRLSSTERYKGHERVFEVLGRLGERHPDLVYVVAGDGDDRARLQRRARPLGERVRFLGHVADELLPDLYRLAQVYVMPSAGEGFGIVFVEAAACGLAVIGGDRDGSRDALRDGLIGAGVDPEDTDALAAAVERALLTPQRAAAADIEPFRRPAFERRAGALLHAFASSATVLEDVWE